MSVGRAAQATPPFVLPSPLLSRLVPILTSLRRATCDVQVTQSIMGGTALVIGGCITLMVFGNHESPILSTRQLIALYRPAYWAYLVVLGGTALAAYHTYMYGKEQFGYG